jgi:hypothetical protein
VEEVRPVEVDGRKLLLAMLEQTDSLEWISAALNREAAIRSVMKIREVGREQAAKIVDGK